MSDGPTHEMALTDAPDAVAREAILRPLVALDDARAGPANARPFAVLLREAGGAEIVGGLWGRPARSWLYVELFFVPGSMRGLGVGASVLRCAEAEAARRGAGAWACGWIRIASRRGGSIGGSGMR
jgi:GNAT superfamily N-acetyltransferase